MASRPPFPDLSSLPKLPLGQVDLARRIELAREPETVPARRPRLARLLRELEHFVDPLRRPFRRIDVAPSARPSIVLILPGFAAHSQKMRYMARQIERAGHKTKRWGLGRNWGANEARMELLVERLDEVRERYDQPVVLLGWSLGGLFARELAKRRPESVSKVITMGTPFSGNPRDNNVWRLYQFIAGHSVDHPPIEADVSAKPPVETVALWSPNDGAIHPRSAAGYPGERDRAIALRCTHMGFSYSPQAISAVLEELERD